MSPMFGRDTLAVHFTFEQVPIDAVLREIEAALAPFDPRPHPGKVHLTPASTSGRRTSRRSPSGSIRGESSGRSRRPSPESTTGDSGGGSA